MEILHSSECNPCILGCWYLPLHRCREDVFDDNHSGCVDLGFMGEHSKVVSTRGVTNMTIKTLSCLCATAALVLGGNVLPARAQQPPEIRTQPISQTVLAGANVQFTVSATGHKPLSYQWRLNGASLSSATNEALFLNSVGAADAGSYSVVITNAVGSITSGTAILTVLLPPSITQQPASSTNALGSNVTFSVIATGTAPLTYRWRFNGTTISGATGLSLQLTDLQTNQCGAYSVVVTNLYGSVESAEANLILMIPPVLAQVQPCPDTALVGEPVIFPFQTCGSSPLAVQVRVNGVQANEAITNQTITISLGTNAWCFPPRICLSGLVDLSRLGLGAGIYFVDVIASNPVGVAASPLMVVAYLADGPVSSGSLKAEARGVASEFPCFPSYILNRGQPGTSTIFASPGCNSRINTGCGLLTNGSWFRFTSTDAGPVVISTEGSTDDTMLAVLQGSLIYCSNMTVVACNSDISPTRRQSRVQFQARATNTYYVVVGGLRSGGTNKLTYGYLPRFVSNEFRSDDSFELRSTLAPPLAYELQASRDLKSNSWEPVFRTNLLSTNSVIYFRDTNAFNFTTRFYRIAPGL